MRIRRSFRGRPKSGRRGPSLLTLAVLVHAACDKPAPAPAPTPQVLVTEVIQQDVPDYLELVGTLTGVQDVALRAQVMGYLQELKFEQGGLVARGDVLYVIDPRPYQQALDEAKGNLAKLTAAHTLAAAELERYKKLVAEEAISEQQYEEKFASEAETESQILSAKAAVDKAQINLGFTQIVAPTDGLVGISQVKVGALIATVNTELATLTKVDPILAQVNFAESDYLYFSKRRGQSGEKLELHPRLVLADGSLHPHPGELYAIDNTIDPRLGTVAVQLSFPNPGNVLRPGGFARVRVVRDVLHDALLVPERAVNELQGQHFVGVVGGDGKTEVRRVVLGPTTDGMSALSSGVALGERVIVEGFQKIKSGVTVVVKPYTAATQGKASVAPGSVDGTTRATGGR